MLIWRDSVDVIRVPTYIGKPVRYPSRELDQINCEDSLEDEQFELNEYIASQSGTTFVKDMLMNKKAFDKKTQTPHKTSIGKKRIRCTADIG